MHPNADSIVPSPRRRSIVVVLGAAGAAALGVGFMRRKSNSVVVSPAMSPESLTAAPAVVTSAAPPTAATAAPMSRDWFLPQLNTAFQMERGELDSAEVKLIDVGPMIKIEDRSRQQFYNCFSIVFESSTPLVKESDTYRLKHPLLGKMELFLSPIGKPTARARYEAVLSQRC